MDMRGPETVAVGTTAFDVPVGSMRAHNALRI
jgi:hypothetical protein